MYAVKYQREGTNRYVCEEMENYKDFIECIVDVAQARGRGWKYRVMDIAEDGQTVRFDVQYTKTE